MSPRTQLHGRDITLIQSWCHQGYSISGVAAEKLVAASSSHERASTNGESLDNKRDAFKTSSLKSPCSSFEDQLIPRKTDEICRTYFMKTAYVAFMSLACKAAIISPSFTECNSSMAMVDSISFGMSFSVSNSCRTFYKTLIEAHCFF